MRRQVDWGPNRSGERVALGTATLVVAFLSHLLLAQLDEAWLPGALAAATLLVGLGASLCGRTHPRFLALSRGYTWTLWIPPVAWFVASLVLVHQGLVAAGLVPAAIATAGLGGILLAQHHELQFAAGHRRGAEFFVSLAVFVSGFTLFGALYSARESGIGIPLLSAGVATALAAVPLRRAAAEDRRTLLYTVLVGLLVGQVAWSLTYWTTAAIVGGALLLLVFYVLVGVSEAILDRTLSRRVVLEYGLVGCCGLALIAGVGPWQP
ncbi:MAG TPA: hypothetical protein VFB73_15365 [Chloroflexota bacterium]|nr:hypothetical protein [Chloroflexota bacterium]